MIQIREGFLKALPLKLDLLKDSLLDVHLLDLVIKDSLILIISFLHDFQVLVILRVPYGIMSEVETLTLLNDPTHPLAEIRVANFTLSLLVLIYD